MEPTRDEPLPFERLGPRAVKRRGLSDVQRIIGDHRTTREAVGGRGKGRSDGTRVYLASTESGTKVAQPRQVESPRVSSALPG